VSTANEQNMHFDNGFLAAEDREHDAARWLGLALAAIAIHQLQSAVIEPGERPFRAAVLGLETVVAASAALSLSPEARRVRGRTLALLSMGPMLGAAIGHLIPIVQGKPIPPATETAPLNLAGGALLLALGLREARS
jgi:TRAP-type uncharacterized transport system fused permease subunit